MTVDEALTRLASTLEADFQIAPDRITADAHLRSDLGLDSLALTDLAFLVQSDFGFESDPEAFRGVTTLRALAEFVTRHAP